ncbi:MAG: putative glycoside hydrolase, partial [Polyangiaceae bacterium]
MRISIGAALVLLGLLTSVSDASAKSRENLRLSVKNEMRHELREEHVSEPAKLLRAEDARGLYVRGQTAGRADFAQMLDHMAARGIDTVVLDAKDYDGLLTYPSKVALANEAGAVKAPPIKDLGAKIREIHGHGLRVAMRVSCFNDELMAKAKPLISVRSKGGHAYGMGWLDPSNPGAQDYIFSLVKESLDAGADEIELDYVRFPVLGIKNADFHLQERNLTKISVIRDFVHRVHAMTRARGVPLSLDVFGVIAFGKRTDIDGLGQDPVVLAQECEVLSPMVYPSHYDPGFAGFDTPGDHPELVGMATKKILEQIDNAKVQHPAKIRPWLQAMAWKSPT